VNAGLFVVAFHLPHRASALIAVLGIASSLLWCAIQLRSKQYVQRWKPLFHFYRHRLGVLWRGEYEDDQVSTGSAFASTSFALAVPVIVLCVWLIVLGTQCMDCGKADACSRCAMSSSSQ
jgi:hypothetical protein